MSREEKLTKLKATLHGAGLREKRGDRLDAEPKKTFKRLSVRSGGRKVSRFMDWKDVVFPSEGSRLLLRSLLYK